MTVNGISTGFGSLLLVYGLSVGVSTVSAAELGRLFATPEERLQIDAARRGESTVHETQGGTAGKEGADQLTLNGTLRGSNGRQRVWINGEGLSPTGANTPATLLYDGRVRLQWQNSGAGAMLKPGQTLDKLTGDVYEAYEAPLAGATPAADE